MISSEVERTLVKSPPELWTELSNPDALARHLGDFGDIRITRINPEHEVEWEAGDTAGTVRIRPSGWGTKVTLTATKDVTVPTQPAEVALASEAAPEIEAEIEATPEPNAESLPEANAEIASEPEPLATVAVTVEPAPRIGFLRRLFGGRRRNALPQAREQATALTAVSEALAPEAVTAADPFSAPYAATVEAPVEPSDAAIESPGKPEPRAQATPATDISAELAAAEEAATDEVTAVLTTVLDRLGAAHHRPFSRA